MLDLVRTQRRLRKFKWDYDDTFSKSCLQSSLTQYQLLALQILGGKATIVQRLENSRSKAASHQSSFQLLYIRPLELIIHLELITIS